jgi:hypothetical protein
VRQPSPDFSLAASPTDTVEIVVSEPIRISVKAAQVANATAASK